MKKPSKNAIIIGICLLICAMPFLMILAVLLIVSYQSSHPDYASNSPAYDFNGFELRNASHYRNSTIYSVDGDISKENLMKLADKMNWKLERYDKPGFVTATAEELIFRFNERKNGERPSDYLFPEITSGYRYLPTRNRNGAGISVTWDEKKERLYYINTSR